MYVCKTCQKSFEEYEHQHVFWSSDTIPVCPFCKISIYQGEFEYKQAKTKDDHEVS